jgi:hypothetical protein
MTLLAKPAVAVVFGAFMLCTETCDHFDAIAKLDWLNMPLHDWTAAGLLISVGVVHRRDYQVIAWAFMLSLLFGAFFGHFQAWLSPTEGDDWLSERVVFPALIALIVIATCALVGTFNARRPSALTDV